MWINLFYAKIPGTCHPLSTPPEDTPMWRKPFSKFLSPSQEAVLKTFSKNIYVEMGKQVFKYIWSK